MLSYYLFLFNLKREVDRFCKELDTRGLAKSLKEKSLSLDQYKSFLIQLHYYILPGPALLDRDVKRMKAEGDLDFQKYLQAHFEIEDTLIPLILTDLADLGVTYSQVQARGAMKEITDLNRQVEKLHGDPDPLFILVSDIAAKVLLDYYTPQIIEVIKPKLPDPAKGTVFLTKDTKSQVDIKQVMLDIMKKRINARNGRRFITELRHIFGMFRDWIEKI